MTDNTKTLPKEIENKFRHKWEGVNIRRNQDLPTFIIDKMMTDISQIYHQAYKEGKKEGYEKGFYAGHFGRSCEEEVKEARLQEKAELEKKMMEAVPEEKAPQYYPWNECRSQVLANIKKIFEE